MKLISSTLFLFALVTSYGQVFSEILKVAAFDRASSDRFGWSVDISGNYAIIGAYADDFGGADPNMGSAYIFEKEGIADWTFVQKIFASDQDDYDRFGWSVAIDGDYAVIGAYAEDHNLADADLQSRAGSAYIFERDGDGTWNEVQKIIASDRDEDDEFGWAVDISGNTIAVGAHYESHDESGLNYIYHTGSVYLFERGGDGVWDETQKIVASDRSADIDFPDGGGGGDDLSDQFGGSLSISGDYLIVGAHHHDYNAAGGAPLNEAGAAYIFERSGGVWSEVEKLDNADRATEDRFGYSVSIDGNYAIVGAHTEDQNAVGAATLGNAGSVYVFERDAGDWDQVQKIVPSDRNSGDRFGWDVSIDDTVFVVGAVRANTDEFDEVSLSDAGAAYTFYLDDSDTWVELNKIDASDRQAEDELGASVAVSGSGIIVGAYQQDYNPSGLDEISNAGAAYFYSKAECESSSSSQTLTLCAGQIVTVGPFTHGETGIYTDVIASVSGCDSTVTTDLTIIPAPSSSQEISICFGYSYDIGGSSHTESGVYADTITGIDGCDSIVYTTLTVSPENAVTHDVSICWGESYTIGASTYTEAGIYTDVITSAALCDCTITTNLTVQLPVDKSISQSLNVLTAGADDASYQWIKCDPYELIVGTGANEQTYIAPTIGKYAVIVTEGVCTDTSSCIYVSVLSTDENTLITPELFPNPNNGLFTIRSQHLIGARLEILNNSGQIIHSEILNANSNLIELNSVAPGIYFARITGDAVIRNQKIIIE